MTGLWLTLFLLVAPSQVTTTAINRGDTIRLADGFPAPVPGLQTLSVLAVAGDRVVIRRGALVVNNKAVTGLSREFLDSLPAEAVSQVLAPGFILVAYDGRGRHGAIRYWAVTQSSALLRGGGRVEPPKAQ